jgi:DNA gyrase inhibitor GyrI
LILKLIGFKNYSPFEVIYRRVLFGYNPTEIKKAFKQLLEYAHKQKLEYHELRTFGIGYDDPDFISPSRCRYDACISLQNENDFDLGLFNIKTIHPGKCIVYLFEGKAEDFSSAWDIVFRKAISNNNIRLVDKPHFEEYLQSNRATEGLFKANLCLPVEYLK